MERLQRNFMLLLLLLGFALSCCPLVFVMNGLGYLQLDRTGLRIELRWKDLQAVQEKGPLSFDVSLNSYYWITKKVLYLNPFDPKSGIQERDVLVVDLTIINESERAIPVASWYLVDKDGKQFEPILLGSIPIREDFSVVVIPPRSIIKGKIAFEVPRGHLPLWLRCAEYGIEVEIR